MSELNARIKSDLKDAMRNKDVEKRDTLRTLTAAIKQREVDERITLTDSDIQQLIQKLVKQRDEASRQYIDANRDDLSNKELSEAKILKAYLPKQLDDKELEEIIQTIVKDINATSQKDMGKVMGAAKSKIGTSADGKRISEMVKKILS